MHSHPKRKAMRFQGEIPTVLDGYGALSDDETPTIVRDRRPCPVDMQLARDVRRPTGYSGEEWLCQAMLMQAQADLDRPRPPARKANPVAVSRRDARSWVESRSDAPFAFEWVCAVLRLEPSAVRVRLLGGVTRRTAVAQLRRVR